LVQNASDKLRKPNLAVPEAKLLLDIIHKRSAQYPTTVDEDHELLVNLQPTDVSTRRRVTAIKVRIGEKEILRQLSFMLSEYLERDREAVPAKRGVDSCSVDNSKDTKTKRKK
jgi:N-lysine methyltransferase SETD6